MRNSNRPAGPGKATTEQRDDATEREELDDTLGATADDVERTGRTPSRQQPSPQARNETPRRDDEDQAERGSRK